VDTIVTYLGSQDASVRCEAAGALTKTEPLYSEIDDYYVTSLRDALSAVQQRLRVETDSAVRGKLNLAITTLNGKIASAEATLQEGTTGR
jgi:hypothetical protein